MEVASQLVFLDKIVDTDLINKIARKSFEIRDFKILTNLIYKGYVTDNDIINETLQYYIKVGKLFDLI